MVPSGCPCQLGATRAHPASRGFTLVELVVVLVILGILAAVAVPRFIDVTGDARMAKMTHLYGSFQTGNQLAHAFWTARGQPANGVMSAQGQVIAIENHWPTPAGALGMLNASNPPPFVPVLSTAELEIRESADRPQCRFIYRPPAAVGTAPVYVNEVTRANCVD
jgi:MSHA pilin protein MshA